MRQKLLVYTLAALIVAAFIFGVFAALLYPVQSYGLLYWVIGLLGPPIYWFVRKTNRSKHSTFRKKSPESLFVIDLCYTGFFLYIAYGYISVLNAMTGHEPYLLRGTVIRLKEDRTMEAVKLFAGRPHQRRRDLREYRATVSDVADGQEYVLDLDAEEFSKAQPGAVLERRVRKGGLGYLYRPFMAFWEDEP